MDFVISLGIFLIYIMSIFLYIKPLGPVFNNDRLVEDIRDNFEDETYWVVKKVLLFVDRCDVAYPVLVEIKDDNALNGEGYGKKRFTVSGKEVKEVFLSGSGELVLKLVITEGCEAELGAVSDIKGVDVRKVNSLKGLDYSELKSKLGVPEAKDFRLIYDGDLIGREVSGQGNVYVREFKEFEVSSDGVVTHKVVNIGIW